MHDPRVSALLRLKRFEQPPPGYFDQLLTEVHRRQRSELLQRPLWKIALERTQVFFSEHSMGNLSYAGAMAVLLVVGVAAIGLMTPGEFEPSNAASNIAKVEPVAPISPIDHGANRMIVLGPQGSSAIAPLGNPRSDSPALGNSAPRYIIDARPASYEPASSF
jgi:hypothetical protein